MGKYSATVMSHFLSPRNAGTLDPPAVAGMGFIGGGNPAVEIYLLIDDGRVREARFKAFRCGATIAAASMLTELVRDRSISECLNISEGELVAALGGPGRPSARKAEQRSGGYRGTAECVGDGMMN